jgi:hypothetical protein
LLAEGFDMKKTTAMLAILAAAAAALAIMQFTGTFGHIVDTIGLAAFVILVFVVLLASLVVVVSIPYMLLTRKKKVHTEKAATDKQDDGKK